PGPDLATFSVMAGHSPSKTGVNALLPGHPRLAGRMAGKCRGGRLEKAGAPLHKGVRRRDGRVAEGARLESVYTGNRIVGSNPTPSATIALQTDEMAAVAAKFP